MTFLYSCKSGFMQSSGHSYNGDRVKSLSGQLCPRFCPAHGFCPQTLTQLTWDYMSPKPNEQVEGARRRARGSRSAALLPAVLESGAPTCTREVGAEGTGERALDLRLKDQDEPASARPGPCDGHVMQPESAAPFG